MHFTWQSVRHIYIYTPTHLAVPDTRGRWHGAAPENRPGNGRGNARKYLRGGASEDRPGGPGRGAASLRERRGRTPEGTCTHRPKTTGTRRPRALAQRNARKPARNGGGHARRHLRGAASEDRPGGPGRGRGNLSKSTRTNARGHPRALPENDQDATPEGVGAARRPNTGPRPVRRWARRGDEDATPEGAGTK